MSSIKEHTIVFRNQKLTLSAEKALYWKEKKALILSDLHLGKAGHFRKSGIAIPKTIDDGNLRRLSLLIDMYRPVKILFLGDLFHSDKNAEWDSFNIWRKKYPHLEMHLVIGNHDFHSPEEYESLGLICSKQIEAAPFLLLHDESSNKGTSNVYQISGHIHPSIRLVGKGRQAKRIPCFHFGETGALLPAFGNLTGTYTIKPGVNDLVFGIIENQIIKIS